MKHIEIAKARPGATRTFGGWRRYLAPVTRVYAAQCTECMRGRTCDGLYIEALGRRIYLWWRLP